MGEFWARWSHWHGEEKSQIRMEVGLRLDFVHNSLIFHLPFHPRCFFRLEETRQEEKNGGEPKNSTRSAPDREERLLPPLLVPDHRNDEIKFSIKSKMMMIITITLTSCSHLLLSRSFLSISSRCSARQVSAQDNFCE